MIATSSIPVSTPRDQGTTVEEILVESVDGLGRVPDRIREWSDAIAVDAIEPTPDVRTLDVPIVERGTPIEIKSAQVEIGNGSRSTTRGRWYLKRAAHERLLEHRGVYLLAVYQPGEGVLAALLVSAATLGELLSDRWIDVDAPRSEDVVAKIGWPTLVDERRVEA